MRRVMALILGLGLSTASLSFAGEMGAAESTVQQMSGKLNRGLVNVLTGWVELPRQMVVSGKERGWWAALPVGIPAGVIMTVSRTCVGAIETVCFCVPIEDTYEPLMEPAFAWQTLEEK